MDARQLDALAGASLSAGALLQTLGWRLMNVTLLPWLFVAIVALVWIGRV